MRGNETKETPSPSSIGNHATPLLRNETKETPSLLYWLVAGLLAAEVIAFWLLTRWAA